MVLITHGGGGGGVDIVKLFLGRDGGSVLVAEFALPALGNVAIFEGPLGLGGGILLELSLDIILDPLPVEFAIGGTGGAAGLCFLRVAGFGLPCGGLKIYFRHEYVYIKVILMFNYLISNQKLDHITSVLAV